MGKIVKKTSTNKVKTSKRIYKIVKRQEGATSVEIEKETNESKQNVLYHLNQLCKEGSIYKVGEKRNGAEIYIAIPKERVPSLDLLRLIIINMGFKISKEKDKIILNETDELPAITKNIGIQQLRDYCKKRDAAYGIDSFDVILQFLEHELKDAKSNEYYPSLLALLHDLTIQLKNNRIFSRKRERVIDTLGERLLNIVKNEKCQNKYLIIYVFAYLKTDKYVLDVLQLASSKEYNDLRDSIILYLKSVIKDKPFWIPSEIVELINKSKNEDERANLQEIYSRIAMEII